MSLTTPKDFLKEFKKQSHKDCINYYYKNTDKPFCETYINPKLKKLLSTHTENINPDKLAIIKTVNGIV